jgi:hypothetical protein
VGAIAPNSETRYYDTFFASTKAAYQAEPVDSYYKEPVTKKWIFSLADSGTALGERVEFAVMLGSFNGSSKLAYGSLDTVTPQDAETTTIGFLTPFTYAMSVGISKQKMKANEGQARKYNYVKGQLDQAIRGQHAQINTDAWASSQDTLAITSIANVISTTTNSGSAFNLSRSTYSKWQQTYVNLAGAAYTASGLNGMRTAEHSIRRGPTAGLADTLFWDDTVDALWQRVTDSRERTEMATSGKGKKPIISESAVFRGMEILPEPVDYPNSTTMRMLVSSHWHFKPFQSDLPGEAKSPYNDGAGWYAYPVVQSGAFWCDSLRFGGAIVGNFTAT